MPHEHNIPGSVHPVENDCMFMFTMVPNSNGKRYRVRCACMAQIKMPRNHDRLYFYVFDDLGAVVHNLWQARFLWTVHLALRYAQSL